MVHSDLTTWGTEHANRGDINALHPLFITLASPAWCAEAYGRERLPHLALTGLYFGAHRDMFDLYG